MPKFESKKELNNLFRIIKSLDRKVVIIFISVAILQTVSWYYTSRLFFQQNFSRIYQSNHYAGLYEFIYWYAGDFFTYFIIPALIIKLLFKSRLHDFGFTFGDYNAGIKLSLGFIFLMLPVIWFVSSEPAFGAVYPLLGQARDSWTIFIIYEAGLFIYLIAWEFIWRGYMLFGLKEKFGYYAILIQMIPFLILHDGKPPIETFGVIFGGIALGILAYRTKSIYYCIVVHACIMFSIDLISTLRYRTGEFGVGMSSLFHILKAII